MRSRLASHCALERSYGGTRSGRLRSSVSPASHATENAEKSELDEEDQRERFAVHAFLRFISAAIWPSPLRLPPTSKRSTCVVISPSVKSSSNSRTVRPARLYTFATCARSSRPCSVLANVNRSAMLSLAYFVRGLVDDHLIKIH